MADILKYSDLFDFSNPQEIEKAISLIETLENTYQSFVDSSTQGATAINKAVKSVIDDLNKQGEALKKLNPLNKEHQKEIDNISAKVVKQTDTYKALKTEQSNLTKQVKTLENELKKLSKAKEATTAATSKNTKAIDAEAGSLKDLQNQLKEARAERDKTAKQINGELNPSYQQAAERAAKLEQAIKQMKLEHREAARTNEVAEDSLEGLRKQLRGATRDYDRLSQAERQADGTGGELLRTIQRLDTEIKSLEGTTGRHQRKVGQYENALNGLKGAASDILQSVGSNGGLMGAIFGGFAAGGAAGAGMAAAEAVVEIFNSLKESVQQANKELRQGEILLKGLPVDELSDVLASLKAAQSEFQEIELFSEGFGSSVQAAKKGIEEFGASSQEATEILNIGFVQAQEKSNTLIETVNEFGSAFNSLGFSFEETVGILSTSSQRGIGRIEDLGDTINEFNIALNRQEFRKQLETAFGGDFASKIFNDFKNDGRGALIELSKQIQKTGTQSKEVQEVLSGVFKSFGEEKDINNILGLFAGLNDGTNLLTQGLTERQIAQLNIIKSNKEVEKSLFELTNQFEGSGGTLTIFTNKLKTLGLNFLIDTIERTKKTFNLFIEALKPFESQLDSLGEGVSDFYKFLLQVEEALNKIRVEFLADILEKLQTRFGELVLIGKEFAPLFDMIGDIIEEVSGFFSDLVKDFEGFGDVFDNLKEIFPDLTKEIDFVSEAAGDMYNIFLDALAGGFIIDGVKNIIALFSALSAAIDATKNNVADFSEGFDKLLNFDFAGAKEQFASSFEDIGDVAVAAFNDKMKDLTFILPETEKQAEEDGEKLGKKAGEKVAEEIKKEVTKQAKSGLLFDNLLDFDKTIKVKLKLDIETEAPEGESEILTGYLEGKKKEVQAARDAEENKREQREATVGAFIDSFNIINETRKQNFEVELQQLQEQKEAELLTVGENKQAQEEINARFAAKEEELRKKSARAERRAAIFNKAVSLTTATVEGVKAVSKAAGALPFPANIPGIVAMSALSAAQIGAILATTIPAFKKGRKGGAETMAIVNEEGQEIGVRSDGSMRLLGSKGNTAEIEYLSKGESVLTAKQSKPIIEDSLKQGNRDITPKQSTPTASINYNEIGRQFGKQLDKRPVNSTIIDSEGNLIKLYQKGNAKIENQNRRLKFGK